MVSLQPFEIETKHLVHMIALLVLVIVLVGSYNSIRQNPTLSDLKSNTCQCPLLFNSTIVHSFPNYEEVLNGELKLYKNINIPK